MRPPQLGTDLVEVYVRCLALRCQAGTCDWSGFEAALARPAERLGDAASAGAQHRRMVLFALGYALRCVPALVGLAGGAVSGDEGLGFRV